MPKPRRLFEICRYVGAGSVGVGLYYLLLYMLTEYAGLWYIVSATVASVVNFGSNFLLQKYWTFKNQDRQKIRSQVGKYALLYAGLTVANLGLLYGLTELLKIWYFAAQIPVSIVLTVFGYLLTRKIFKT